MKITTTQTQKTNKKMRRNGFYLVKADGQTIGSFEKLWHTSGYRTSLSRAPLPGRDYRTHSTKQQAIDTIVNRQQKTRTLLNQQGCESDCNEESLGSYFNI